MRIRPMQQKPKLKTTDYVARAIVSHGESGGVTQVTQTLSTEDVYGVPTVLCHLKLTPAEARALAARLVTAADAADLQPGAHEERGAP